MCFSEERAMTDILKAAGALASVPESTYADVLRSELEPGEKLRWLGRPDVLRAATRGTEVCALGAVLTLGVLMWAHSAASGSDSGLMLSHGALAPAAGLVLGAGLPLLVRQFLTARGALYVLTDRRLGVRTGRSYRWYTGADLADLQCREFRGGKGDLSFTPEYGDSEGEPAEPSVTLHGITGVREIEELLRALREEHENRCAPPLPSGPLPTAPLPLPTEGRYESLLALEAELRPGERVLWTGQPRGAYRSWRKSPAGQIGVAAAVTSPAWLVGAWLAVTSARLDPPDSTLILWYLLFGAQLAAGLAQMWTAREGHRAARETTYAVTDQRVLLIFGSRRRVVRSLSGECLRGAIAAHGRSGTGHVYLPEAGEAPRRAELRNGYLQRPPALLEIEDPDAVISYLASAAEHD